MSLADVVGRRIAAVSKWIIERGCSHHWRPARTRTGLARYCQMCGRIEPLTREMFYARFGRYIP